jgi:hypothetical protein
VALAWQHVAALNHKESSPKVATKAFKIGQTVPLPGLFGFRAMRRTETIKCVDIRKYFLKATFGS